MSNLDGVPNFSFRIPSQEVNGPLNLQKTILSAQTSEPEWARAGERFYDVENLEGTPTKYSVSQCGDVDHFELEVHVTGKRPETIVAKLTTHLTHVLGLRDDLHAFHRIFAAEAEPLSLTFSRLRGLRLMRGTSLYESLICSILSQNRSAWMWNRTARLLMQYYGQRVEFPDKSTSFLFPRPEVLAAVPARELRAKTSIGYRAKPVVQTSKLISKEKFKLDELNNYQYNEALESLLDLPGVGPKVADCFLLYGVGMLEAAPVDVWIHRIVTKLYFRGRKVSRLKTAEFLRDRYGKWAGYAQLYLFDYARRSGNIGLGNAKSRARVAS